MDYKNFDGILLVDKPLGWSSFDVVAKVRGQLKYMTGLKKPKVGHTGTLDPLATGLMILVLGSYCKRASEFSKLDKTYKLTMKLGEESTTGDAEGEITLISDKTITKAEFASVLPKFVGDISQVPPAYSAVKIGGQRAYALARAGKEVVIEPRVVHVDHITLDAYNFPEAQCTASVSSGTYIRSLVQDIGRELGVGAYMSGLRRTTVGVYSLENAIETNDKLPNVLMDAILKT